MEGVLNLVESVRKMRDVSMWRVLWVESSGKYWESKGRDVGRDWVDDGGYQQYLNGDAEDGR